MRKSKSNQAATTTTFSTNDHYTVKTGRITEGRRGWAYKGTLYRNSVHIATYQEFGDGGAMRVMFSNVAEQEALRAWFATVEPRWGSRFEVDAVIDTIVMASDNEARMRKTMRKEVYFCVPGDVRNRGKSKFYKAKPVAGTDLMTAAKQVQQERPECVVLNLLPFDAAFAMLMTLNAI
ncbi:hypothetical protein [Burkholderia sp. LMG 13014]|uniref:hypothetical protein n=1 Tax=Burkholderia sp. LMG 13014 TaxID=2709306 RepID=UPI0019648ECF|nr:hypothetical protein [Burkholderia sp. LMG 13014]